MCLLSGGGGGGGGEGRKRGARKEGRKEESRPLNLFCAIMRFSRIWREIRTFWRETWAAAVLKPCFRPENKA